MSPAPSPLEPVEIIAEFTDRVSVGEEEQKLLEKRRSEHPEEGLVDCITIAEFTEAPASKPSNPAE